MSPKNTVVTATTRLFVQGDVSAIDEYFGPTYVQHSTLASDGVDGLRALASSLPSDFKYEPARAFEDGDLVVTHGVYYGFGPAPLVGFDLWRVDGDRIVEHWDSLTPVVENTASGRTQTDGPTTAGDLSAAAANKALVEDFFAKVLIGGDYSILTDYISTETYDQHNPGAADGLAGFGAAAAAWAEEGKLLVYKKLHQIVAEGDFVFARSEGEFGVPVIYNDLWRIEDGKLVEHWDVITPVPAELPHTNGVF